MEGASFEAGKRAEGPWASAPEKEHSGYFLELEVGDSAPVPLDCSS